MIKYLKYLFMAAITMVAATGCQEEMEDAFSTAPVAPTLTSNGVRVEWNLINGNNCYYQVSIFAEGDEDEPYFVSQLLEGDNLDITMTTTGVVNRLNELKYGTPCKARLAVIMLEDGVPHNDVYATNNLQAVLYATSSGTFSPEF